MNLNLHPVIDGFLIFTEQRTRLLDAVLVLLGAVTVAGLVLIPKAGLVVLVGGAALWFLVVLYQVLEGSIDGMLLLWALSFPLGSFMMFPRDHPIVTLDRAVGVLGLIGLFLVKPGTLTATPGAMRRTGFACLAFVAVAGVTLGKCPDFLSSARLLVDSFVVPLLFGWFVITWLDVRRRLPAIHTAVCISSLMCAAMAAAEIVTGEDLLPVGNSAMFFAGGIPRPNGPFSSNDELALIGGLSLFFLLFLRAALGPKLSTGRRLLHAMGLAAAIGMALMPMFRSVALTLLLVLIIDTFWEQRTSPRAWRSVLILTFAGLLLLAKEFAPDIFADRSGADNLYSRVAQNAQTLTVFADHPVLGVGFSNFNNFVSGETQYRMSYEGVSSVDWPHSNLGQAIAETGILGFVPYVMMHILLFMAMWQLRRSSASGSMVWRYFVYLFLAYWITGLTESSGFEYMNIWYVFATAVCYKYGLTGPDSTRPREVQIPCNALRAPA